MIDSLVTTMSLTSGWRLTRRDAGADSGPSEVEWSGAIPDAVVPGTVASTLIGAYDPDNLPDVDYDDYDWWYQCDFDVDGDTAHSELVFDGLATIADIWLNGEQVHQSRNMFRSYRVDVSGQLSTRNILTIAFRSISQDLEQKRPRPRWKTNLIGRQQLRWVRTTLLGRIPGWTPPIAPVGPWRDIRLERAVSARPVELGVLPFVENTRAGITVQGKLEVIDPAASVTEASLAILGETHELKVTATDDGISIDSHIDPGEVDMWSPESPALHEFTLSVRVDGRVRLLRTGKLGFRSVELDRTGGRLCFKVNGHDVFCRGACWTTNDIVSLIGDERRLKERLELFRSAGGNMIRVGGTMVYEADTFYDLCDELGIMIWQDFMFANMDYPSFDLEFLDDVREEIAQQLHRLRNHACIFAWCGNSEVEQQSAMFGMAPDLWRNELFYEVIPELIERISPGIPYFPSSPSEGALPFHNAEGPSHFFGVGAYKQSLPTIASSHVKFSSECLAFSNVPSDRALTEHFGSASPPVHHPRWKTGVPRDSAAGWDFEDIRDHYIEELYGLDPVQLRYADKERYIAISQVVTGEVIERVFEYWRSPQSECSGGLIWQLNDIVPGAGWGLIDSDGRPKPLYYFLRRCWGDITLTIDDRGLDGLEIGIKNESGLPFVSTLNVQLLHHSRIKLSNINQSVKIAPGERVDLSVDNLLGRFFDTTYRYRFGPPKHDVVVAALIDDDGAQTLTRCYFPMTHNIRVLDRAEVSIECSPHDGGTVHVNIRADCFLQHVRLFSRTHEFDDNYFCLAPGIEKKLHARPVGESDRQFRGTLTALNLSNPVVFN